MQDDNKVLIKNWLNKSNIALEDTRKNIEIDSLETAQNRLYYALFYAVSALAKSENFVTTKHGQLLGWFNQSYINTGKVDKNIAKIYRISFENRQKSDYTFFYNPKKEKLERDLLEAAVFINEIKKILADKI